MLIQFQGVQSEAMVRVHFAKDECANSSSECLQRIRGVKFHIPGDEILREGPFTIMFKEGKMILCNESPDSIMRHQDLIQLGHADVKTLFSIQ